MIFPARTPESELLDASIKGHIGRFQGKKTEFIEAVEANILLANAEYCKGNIDAAANYRRVAFEELLHIGRTHPLFNTYGDQIVALSARIATMQAERIAELHAQPYVREKREREHRPHGYGYNEHRMPSWWPK